MLGVCFVDLGIESTKVDMHVMLLESRTRRGMFELFGFAEL